MNNPIVTIEMENGKKITAELYPDIAPQSVRNFHFSGQQRVLQRADLPPLHLRVHDPRRLPRRNRHGRSRLLHQG